MRAQRSDCLTLEQALQVMANLGTADEYIEGYAKGFSLSFVDPRRLEDQAFARGFRAGRDALRRGAHGGAS